jgi:hypothetical protein
MEPYNVRNDDKQKHCLDVNGFGHDEFWCRGLVMKVWHSHGIKHQVYLLPDEEGNLVATDQMGNVVDTPLDWVEMTHQGEHNQCRVKIETYNLSLSLRKKAFRSLAHIGSHEIHQITGAQATIMPNGRVLTGAVAGDVDRASGAQNTNADSVNANQHHYFYFVPQNIKNAILEVNLENSVRFLYKGTCLKFDYSVDNHRVGKRAFTLSEVECCLSAYQMEANANTHWFISHQMAKALTIYMEEFWGKWPQ